MRLLFFLQCFRFGSESGWIQVFFADPDQGFKSPDPSIYKLMWPGLLAHYPSYWEARTVGWIEVSRPLPLWLQDFYVCTMAFLLWRLESHLRRTMYSYGEERPKHAELEFLNDSWGRKTGVDLSLPLFLELK